MKEILLLLPIANTTTCASNSLNLHCALHFYHCCLIAPLWRQFREPNKIKIVSPIVFYFVSLFKLLLKDSFSFRNCWPKGFYSVHSRILLQVDWLFSSLSHSLSQQLKSQIYCSSFFILQALGFFQFFFLFFFSVWTFSVKTGRKRERCTSLQQQH